MTTAFDRALAHTVGIEGGYSNNPADSGGATRFGVTERLARAHGYMGEMRELPIEIATEIYRLNFWMLLHLGAVAVLSEAVALEVFDTAVNTKQGFAAVTLQRCLNTFNREQADYPDTEVDGLIGHDTLASLSAYLKKRGAEGEQVLVEALNALQGAFYIGLAEARPKDEAFTYGWFLNRVMKQAGEQK
jgi:lysozyme family protein